MNKRQKTLKLMAEQAGLTAVKFDCRQSRHYLMCEADNGNRLEFWLSTASILDPRAEQNELSRMKRFARENAAPIPAQVITPKPSKEPPTMTVAKAPAQTLEKITNSAPTKPVVDMSPTEFLRLAMWLQNQDLVNVPSMDALVLDCSKHMDKPVDEDTVRSAMIELGKAEPARWSEPTDPHAILVREMGRLLKELGIAPTDAFNKLASRVLR